MEAPEWLREVRDEYEGNGAWASVLNILDNEEEEFDADTDLAVAAQVSLNLAELADEVEAAYIRTAQACAAHLSRSVGVRLVEAAAAQGRAEGPDSEIEVLRLLLGLVIETMSVSQWQAFVEQDYVEQLLAQ